jgi:HAD superfamily hydrolase (TIGR01549 family)
MIKGICFDVSETLLIRDDEFNKQLRDLRNKLFADATGSKDPQQDYLKAYKNAGSHSAVFSQLGFATDYWQGQIKHLDADYQYQKNDNVVSTLHELFRNNYQLFVCTNRLKTAIVKKFVSVGIDPKWFKGYITNENMTKPKPDLEAFRSVIKITKIPSENILFVGDRIEADILPAKAVGMQTCIVWSSSVEADYSAPNFTEISRIVKNIL